MQLGRRVPDLYGGRKWIVMAPNATPNGDFVAEDEGEDLVIAADKLHKDRSIQLGSGSVSRDAVHLGGWLYL